MLRDSQTNRIKMLKEVLKIAICSMDMSMTGLSTWLNYYFGQCSS